jgi:hypothetical protein
MLIKSRRKIECQIIGRDGPAGESMEVNSVTSYDEWSYSDLDPSSEFMREASSTAIHR